MSTPKTFYTLKSKAIPTRYGLSKNIQTLLQGLESYHSGSMDVAELGRLVRLSPRRRAAVANTITKCAGILKKDPSEVKTCVDVIEMCTELLEIAGIDRKDAPECFPFMKLPMEIRERALDLIISNTFRSQLIVPAGKLVSCRCPRFDRDNVFQTSQMKSLPTLLGAALNQEFYRIFFRKKKFRFRCSCELLAHLRNNTHFKDHIRHIVVHWCGPESAAAFTLLPKCKKLETLTLNLSKSTLMYLNERAAMMRTYFPLSYRNMRISDVLGLDELLRLRGLLSVQVHHIPPKSTSHSVETDRACLEELLSNKLTVPQEDPSTEEV